MNDHTNLPIPRATIEDIVQAHDEALALYEQAFNAMEIADIALKAAHVRAHDADGGQFYVFGGASHVDEIQEFRKALCVPERGRYMRTAKKLLANGTWANLVKMTELERLMDAKAKEELRQQMNYVPDRVNRDGEVINEAEIAKGLPPITVENVYATLEKFRGDAGLIFCRGIANVFSALDRRFKSHDGFKIGSRIILTRMFNEWGKLAWGGPRDTLIDVERVFSVLDGHPEGAFQSTLHMLENERSSGFESRQSFNENEYFRVRGFKNGNAHLWFLRDDLVEKVNKLLAEYYGEVIADGETQEADPLQNRKLTPARRFGFFPTPQEAVEELFQGRGCVSGIPILRRKDEPRLRILEPSAGTGNLARRCITRLRDIEEWRREAYAGQYRFDNLVDCVEIQPALAAGLEAEGIYNRVICADFLSLRPEAFEPYDLIVMNPPFDLERDIDHVTHALEFLKPGGRLFSIMSAGTEFRGTRKSIAFRELVKKHGGATCDLPPGSFKESGTMVNTVMLTMRRRAA